MAGETIFTKAILNVDKILAGIRDKGMESTTPGLMERAIRQDAARRLFNEDDQFRQKFLSDRDTSTPQGQKAILHELGGQQ